MAAARLGVGVDWDVRWLRQEVVIVELVGGGRRSCRGALPEHSLGISWRVAVQLEYREGRPALLVEELGGGGLLR